MIDKPALGVQDLLENLRKVRNNPRAALRAFLCTIRFDWFYNSLLDFRGRRRDASAGLVEIDEIRQRARRRTDISDHLLTLFVESLSVAPRLIVELGVRDGESTFALERAARLWGASLVSIDIAEIGNLSTYTGWIRVQSDDLQFAASFADWCAERGIAPRIDVLFIDTSHSFEHTSCEIESWFPYLSARAKVFFHDTNLVDIYRREDGSIGFANNGRRAVMRAVERYLGASYDETRRFVDVRDGWLVKHWPNCNGLTLLERLTTSVESNQAAGTLLPSS